jgi:hypothetical protein
MKKFPDGSVLYEPHEKITKIEWFKSVLELITILPTIIKVLWKTRKS